MYTWSIKKYAFWILVLLVLGYVGFSAYLMLRGEDPRACRGFGSWQAAQDRYLSDTEKYKAFDRDNDGIACETLLLK